MQGLSRTAVLGFGNMAQALFRGAARVNMCDSRLFHVFDPQRTAPELLPFQYASSVSDAIQGANTTWLCVKPDVVPSVAQELSQAISSMDKHPLFVSIAAGVSEASIRAALQQPEAAVIRVMPNMPVLVGKGASGYYSNAFVTPKQLQSVRMILNATGVSIQVEHEADLNKVTAVSGSGPAYVLRFMRAFIDAAKHTGLSEDVARTLVMQTVKGAVQLADSSECGLDELCEQVRSKGGTTDAALRSFDRNDLDDIINEAVMAAHDRSLELGAPDVKGEHPGKKPERELANSRSNCFFIQNLHAAHGNADDPFSLQK